MYVFIRKCHIPDVLLGNDISSYNASPAFLCDCTLHFVPSSFKYLYHALQCNINPLKTKHRLFYLKTQSIPRCKHFSSRL